MCFPFFIFRSRGGQHNEQRGDQESDHNSEQGGQQVVEQGDLQVSGHDGEPHSHIVITGAQGGTTPAPNRLEINDLIKDTMQFSLYIQALSKPIPSHRAPTISLISKFPHSHHV
jgi:hypothetical protein